MSRALSLAGFQVILIGRFWVTTEAMNSNKPKKEPSNTILAVQTEMALPRMSKSARIAELNLDTARISERPRTTIPGTVDELIPSRRPNQVDKAQISIEGAHGYRDFRIENSLTDEHGDEVKLKKGAHVEITVTAEDAWDTIDPAHKSTV
jgi:hypothetical protein